MLGPPSISCIVDVVNELLRTSTQGRIDSIHYVTIVGGKLSGCVDGSCCGWLRARGRSSFVRSEAVRALARIQSDAHIEAACIRNRCDEQRRSITGRTALS